MNANLVKTSDIYFAGAIAAEGALPEESRAIIEKLDSIQRKWINDGYAFPTPIDLAKARADLNADPLALAAMEIRRLGNQASQEERDAQDSTAVQVTEG